MIMGKCPWRGPRDLSSAYLHGELFSSLFFITKPLSCKVQKVNPFDTQNSLIQRLSNSFFPRSLDLLLTIFYASFVALSCKQMLLGLLSLKGSKTNWEASPTQSPWPSKTGKAFPLSLQSKAKNRSFWFFGKTLTGNSKAEITSDCKNARRRRRSKIVTKGLPMNSWTRQLVA